MKVVRLAGSNVSPSDDAKILEMVFNDGLFEDITITTLGAAQLNIPAMYGILEGRDFTTDDMTFTAELPESSGTGYILVHFDTSDSDLISITSQLAPYTPVYDDINASGSICEMVIATYQADSTQVTSVAMTYNLAKPSGSGAAGGSLINVVTTDSTLIGSTVTIEKDGEEIATGTMSSDLNCELSTTEIGELVITCGSETSTLVVRYYTNYTVSLGTWHFGWYKAKNVQDPASRIGYIVGCDNENYTSAYMDYTAGEFNYGDWADAPFMPRPCMLKSDGTVDYYLDPDDYTLKEDGTASDVTNTAYDGNAMIEWDKFYTYTYEDSDYEYFHISNKQLSANYKCYSNIDANGAEIDHFYTRIYEGSVSNAKLRSLSGVTPMNTQTGTTEISYATANNTTATVEWYTGVWADRDLVDNLLILLGKSTDVQTVFGNGHYTGGSSASDLLATGTMNNRGLFYGTNGTWAGVKVFGMENWWGNAWERIAGLIQKSGYIYTKKTYDTTDGTSVTGYPTTSVTGMINSGKVCAGTTGGYISKTYASNQGIIPYTASGSSSTYECDGLYWDTNAVGYALVGGYCNGGLLVGAFAVVLYSAVSDSGWAIGASLSCKPAA